MSAYIKSLQDAIRKMHGCASSYLESVEVEEWFQGKIVWKGTVEVFKLESHATAKTCYAWSHAEGKDDKETRFFAVLHVPPIDTPRKAVQAAIVSSLKSSQ